jgi:hypothetical protein
MKTSSSILMTLAILCLTARAQTAAAPGAALKPPIGGADAKNQPTAKNYSSLSAGGISGDFTPALIIRFNDATNSTALEQDLAVMTHLVEAAVERSVGDDSPPVKAGIAMTVTTTGRSVRPMYIDGLGALFMIKVNFPLIGPAPKEEEKVADPAANSEWDKAKRELFAEKSTRSTYREKASTPFNSAQVDALKVELTTVLKQAANIRGLGPDEFVSISVFGHPAPVHLVEQETSQRQSQQLSWPNREVPGFSSQSYYASAGSGAGTVLTIRAKKADIDAFNNGRLDPDGFKAKVQSASYVGSGYSVTSVNSWIKGGSTSRLF